MVTHLAGTTGGEAQNIVMTTSTNDSSLTLKGFALLKVLL